MEGGTEPEGAHPWTLGYKTRAMPRQFQCHFRRRLACNPCGSWQRTETWGGCTHSLAFALLGFAPACQRSVHCSAHGSVCLQMVGWKPSQQDSLVNGLCTRPHPSGNGGDHLPGLALAVLLGNLDNIPQTSAQECLSNLGSFLRLFPSDFLQQRWPSLSKLRLVMRSTRLESTTSSRCACTEAVSLAAAARLSSRSAPIVLSRGLETTLLGCIANVCVLLNGPCIIYGNRVLRWVMFSLGSNQWM